MFILTHDYIGIEFLYEKGPIKREQSLITQIVHSYFLTANCFALIPVKGRRNH